MEVREVFQHVSDVQMAAIMFHEEMSEYFSFLGLEGFERMHDYQMIEEGKAVLKTRKRYLKRENGLLKLDTERVNSLRKICIPDDWRNYKRTDVSKNFVVKSVRVGMQHYLDWETYAKHEYEACADVMAEKKCKTHENYFVCLAGDSENEIVNVTDIMIDLTVADYNIDYILEMQRELCKKYK